MLQEASFRRVGLFGSDGATPYELGSPRLIVVAIYLMVTKPGG
jgi:hypothetical protein